MLDLPIVGTFNTYFMEPEYLRLVKLDKYKRVSETIWRIVARFYNRCDLILSPSEKTAFDLKEHKITKPIEVMPNGVDLSFVKWASSFDVDLVKKRFGLGDKVVLYVGRLSREKSLDVLLQVFAEVVKRVLKAQLLIVGDGPIRGELEKLARDLGISGQVIFTGLLEHDELLSSGIFQACSIFCTASSSEVQPMSVIEAMAVGLPIVGVAARGMVNLVENNGVLVQAGDVEGMAEAVVELLLSEKKLKRAGRQSRIVSREHDIEKVAGRMEKVYRRLIK
jgi:1,2-diacylglycerol 3-alpha-glucosyltransferase